MNKLTMASAWTLMLVAVLAGCNPETVKTPGGKAVMAVDSPEAAGARKVADAYLAALNRGDASAAADCWTADGEYVNETTGLTVTGRDAIGKALGDLISPDARIEAETVSHELRLVAPGVVCERGRSRFAPENGPVEHARFIALYVLRDGRWKIHRVWQTELPITSNYDRLASLSWMIGEWDGDKEGGRETKNVCRWSRNRNFITRTYKVLEKGKVLVTGTEIIGWDPAEKRVRSWAFDSTGGFAEGVWRFEGAKWRPVEVLDVAPGKLDKHQAALKGLSWLVGRWSDQQAAIEMTWRWTENNAFLVQKFKVSEAGQPDQEGIRIFGLDPELGQIRSWMFDTDGGLAESTWSRSDSGDELQARTRHVLPDGRLASSIGICRKATDDSITWQRVAEELDGEMLPKGPIVTLVRQSAGK